LAIWRMRTACWITKATHTLSDYATPTAFPVQQLLQVHASMLRYPYGACLVQYSHKWPDMHYRLRGYTEKWSAVYYSEFQEHNRSLRPHFSVSDLFSNVFKHFAALRSSRAISDRSFNLFHFFHRLPFNIVRFCSPFSASSSHKAISCHYDFYNRRFCAVCGISLSIFPN
jgi:hypothetical protein